MTVIKLPGQYAKFVTAALGQLLLYFQIYGWTWHIKEAAVMAGVALAVLGIPNSTKPAPAAPPAQPPPAATPPAV